MIGSWLRRTGFWAIDALKGGAIRNHYNDIKYKIANPDFDANEQLNKIFEHAKNTTSFYRNIKGNNLEDFPVINKSDIKENFQKFQSELYKNKPLHQMSTSGSTGTPFTVNQDMNKRKRTLADIIYFNEIAGQKLGDKYIYFRVWTDLNRKSKLEQFMQNLIPIDILHLDDDNLETIRQLLTKDKSINSALAYASTYEYLVKYLIEKKDLPKMFNIKLLVSGAEVLNMEIKRLIKETIGCSIVDRYSNQENGVIAQSNDLSELFRVNTASYKIELLHIDDNSEVEEGELGRIVLTDLFNFAMPIIRYDTGDIAIKVKEDKSNNTNFIKTIQGRRVDTIYNTEGKRLTPLVLGTIMWNFNKLKQYQLIQEDQKKYTFKVNGAKGFYSYNEITEALKPILGVDAEIDIVEVEGIPVLSSGKFKRTICNYKPN